MAGLVKVPINNQGGFAGWSVPAVGGTFRRLSEDYIAFGNATEVGTDGVTRLVNSGFGLDVSATVYSGQGLRWDGTQSADTGVVLDLSTDFTLLTLMEYQIGQVGSFQNAARAHFGFDGAGLRCGIGAGAGNADATSLAIGNLYTVAIRYSVESGDVVYELLGTDVVGTFNVGAYEQPTIPMFIGKVNGANISYAGIMACFLYIPRRLEDYKLARHFQYPHLTVYKEGSLLKSAILDKDTLSWLASGVGCYYPMSEGVGSVIHDVTVPDQLKKFTYRADWEEIIPNHEYTFNSVGDVATRALYLGLSAGTYYLDIEVIDYEVGQLYYIGGTGAFKFITSGEDVAETIKILVTGEYDPFLYVDEGITSRMRVKINSIRRVTPITNALVSDVWGNGAQLNIGMSSVGYEQDEFGLLKSLNRRSELVGDGRSYIDLHSKKIQGNFYLDLFADIDIATVDNAKLLNCSAFNSAGVAVGDFYIYIESGVIKMLCDAAVATIGDLKSITSIDVINGVFTVIDNSGLIVASINSVISHIALDAMLTDVKGVTAVYINKGTRTDAERDFTRLKLKAKHGVI